MRAPVLLAVALSGAGFCADSPAAIAVPETGRTPAVMPPAMPRRQMPTRSAEPGGESLALDDQGARLTLFLPDRWRAGLGATVLVSLHFHGAEWFIAQEHRRAGHRHPLLTCQAGEGSAVYRRLAEETNRLARVLRRVEAELARRGAPAGVRVTAVDVSSFSAGYGAVSELLKAAETRRLIRRVVLADSLYAGLVPDAHAPSGRRPDPQHIEPWLAFAREAVEGRKTFVLTHSAVPTPTFASSAECAAALIAALGLPAPRPVSADALPAARVLDYPLRTRCDAGRFHVWGYAGQDAQAHLTHVRHLADLWRALDQAGE